VYARAHLPIREAAENPLVLQGDHGLRELIVR
jgi:hypothetical protein